MQWRNPAYNAAGTIDCEINHPDYGWIPFTAAAGDTGAQFDVTAMLAEITAAGNIAPYVPPDPPTAEELRAAMAPLTRRQLFIALASEGHLSEQDAEDAAAGSAIPAAIAAIFDTLPAAERRAARITFRSFTLAYRLDPMVPVILLASPNPPDDAALDTMWLTYVTA